MHRTLIAPALLLAAGLALTGCGGGKNEAKPAKTEAAETTQAAEASTPTTDPAVWSAWAKRTHANIDGWKDNWDAMSCNSIAMADGDVKCTVLVDTWTQQLTTVDAKIQSAVTADSGEYLGDVPDSQQATVSALINTVNDGMDRVKKWDDDDCVSDPSENQCMGTALEIQNSMEDVDAALASLE